MRIASSRQDIDGMGLCETCLRFVGDDDVCGEACAQGELARVLKYIRAKAKQEHAGTFTEEALDDLHSELSGGAHR